MTMDETGRVPGRGAYLCRDVACWKAAIERGALGRALETQLPPPLREELLAVGKTMTTTEGGEGGKE